MTNPLNSVLVQNIETFEHIISLNIDGLSPENALSAWLETRDYGIVSFDEDPDGEFGYIALVASTDGPDFMLDEVTGEMEPVEKIDPAVELELKLDIAMELENDADEAFLLSIEAAEADLIPVLVDDINLAPLPTEANPIVNPVAFTPPSKNSTKGTKMKAHQYLSQLITNNPGISRVDVFANQDLRDQLIDPLVQAKINTSDKLEVKRWNRRLNRFIRQIRRDGEDIRIERTKNVASYTIGSASGQLEIPFDTAAASRNSAITDNNVSDEVLDEATPIAAFEMDAGNRATEDKNVDLSFEDLLSTLDDEAVATVAK